MHYGGNDSTLTYKSIYSLVKAHIFKNNDICLPSYFGRIVNTKF